MTEVLFLLCVIAGTFVQSVTGFALGMIVMAVCGALALYPLPVVAAVVSIIALTNFALALPGHFGKVARHHWLACISGQLPGTVAGVLVLNWLSASAVSVLQFLLGLFIVVGCLSMMVRPQPLAAPAPLWQTWVAGLAGGILAGLFAAAGPVLGWFFYRQPWSVAAIRATLMACFATSTLVRTATVGLTGGLTRDVLVLCALSVPAVLVVTLAVRRWPPRLSDQGLRRLAFGVLLVMGAWLLARGLLDWLAP